MEPGVSHYLFGDGGETIMGRGPIPLIMGVSAGRWVTPARGLF